jgi:UDP-N-acetylglucosamine pyrophosphorylase
LSYEGHELRVFGVRAHLASFMAKYKNNTQVEVISGTHAGKVGTLLVTTGKTCLVKFKEGSYHIAENNLKPA